MAFVVEDGTGKADANSYASVAAADVYASDRGITAWAALTTADKQEALIKATDFIEQTYRLAWKGWRNTETQALSWPRVGVVADDFPISSSIVPSEVIKACIELANKSSGGEVLGGDIGRTIKREKVDVIETEYSDYGPTSTQYVSVSRTLAPYLVSAASGGGFAQVGVIRT